MLANFETELTSEYYQLMGKLAKAIVSASDGDEEAAKKHLVKALDTMGQYNDLGSVRIRDRAVQAVADLIPAAKGKPRRLRKLWYSGVQMEKPFRKSFLSTNNNYHYWLIGIFLYVVLKACIQSSMD